MPRGPSSIFDEARAAFAAAGQTIANVRRDFPEWHRGRPRYALWAVDVDVPAVRDAVSAAGTQLADLLLPDYRRQPHITLGLCGFPVAEPREPDDFGPTELSGQLAALRALAPAPFDIDIGLLASFSSAPFLAVHDPQGGIARLRRSLTSAQPEWAEPDGAYTPHVTVGLYAGSWPTADIQRRLDRVPAGPALRCRVDRIGLMHYAAAEIGGPLTTEAEFHLATRQFG